jgi:hypothetical protein
VIVPHSKEPPVNQNTLDSGPGRPLATVPRFTVAGIPAVRAVHALALPALRTLLLYDLKIGFTLARPR